MSDIVVRDEGGFNQVFAPVGSTPLRQQRRNDWTLDQIARVKARRVLEIGSGTGESAAYLAARTGAEVVAVDISPAFIAMSRERYQAPNLRFEQFDLLGDAPLAFGQFDMICGNGILHHLVKRLPEVLTTMRQLTNPGGGMAFIEPNFLNPYCALAFGTRLGRRFARLEPDEMAFKPSHLRHALTAAGWQDVVVKMRDFLVPGLPLPLVKPTLALEPLLEGSAMTSWLAQSHFMTARA
ncbi:MAG: class I SAM-dependent methyltransferase [Novosphingobium sp.]